MCYGTAISFIHSAIALPWYLYKILTMFTKCPVWQNKDLPAVFSLMEYSSNDPLACDYSLFNSYTVSM